jgi:hypothetical protein
MIRAPGISRRFFPMECCPYQDFLSTENRGLQTSTAVGRGQHSPTIAIYCSSIIAVATAIVPVLSANLPLGLLQGCQSLNNLRAAIMPAAFLRRSVDMRKCVHCVVLSVLLTPLAWAGSLVIRCVTVIDATGLPNLSFCLRSSPP